MTAREVAGMICERLPKFIGGQAPEMRYDTDPAWADECQIVWPLDEHVYRITITRKQQPTGDPK